MTLTEYLQSVRTLTPEQVDQIEQGRDTERGPYVPHHGDHHHPGEAAH